MPRGDKSSYTSKQKRQAEDIEESYERKGVAKAESERRAWATVNKMTGGGLKRKSASKKTAARKASSRKTAAKKSTAKKVALAKTSGKGARKSAAPKPAAKKSAGTRKAGKHVAVIARTATKTKHVLAKTGKAAARGAPKKSQQAGKRAAKATSAKLSPRKLSPEAKKNLAARHLWELVKEKKRRAAQPPAWQKIGHHDPAVPRSRAVETVPANSEPAKFHIGSHLDRGDG